MNSDLRVTWTGAALDLSGYAEAARGYILSLDSVGVEVAVDVKEFETWKSQKIVDETVPRKIFTLMKKGAENPIRILHLTADQYDAYANLGTRRIGYYAWETNKLPQAWVKRINRVCHEAWVPSEYLRRVSVHSGVKIPVRVLHHAIPVPPIDWKPHSRILNLPEDKFIFYSISQWSGRKNMEGLIKAYYEEFSAKDNVLLLLKTYHRNDDVSERDLLRQKISRLKRNIKGGNCPPLMLIENMLGAGDILSMHYNSDCYVTMTRNEGFGLGPFQSAAMGNPIIVPDYSAFPEHFNNENAYMIDINKEVSVNGMEHISPLFTSDMVWSDPSEESCGKHMRYVYEHQEEANAKGLIGRDYIEKNLSYKKIGNQIVDYLRAPAA